MTELGGQSLSLQELAAIAAGERVCIAAYARGPMEASRRVVRQAAAEHRPVYGINTGFGKLCDVKIPDADIERLQLNLVRSHACGIGPLLGEGETRVMVALRANTLALGYSGVRPEVADALCEMINRGVCPAIPSKGSVGASGDLAPLAHLALCAIGEGEAIYRGRRMAAGEALRDAGLVPLRLEAKEGLALLNGTQALTAVGALALWRAHRLAEVADLAGALTLRALLGTPVAFDQRIHAARPHPGQAAVAARLRDLLGGSEAAPVHVQDAYSLRCMPQVHGAVRGALAFARQTVGDRERQRDRQPAGVRRDGRRAQRRQLSWGSAGARLRHGGDRYDDAGFDRGAAHRPAGESRPQPGAAGVSGGAPGRGQRIHDRARGGGLAAQRVQGTGASGERGQSADLGRPGGSCFDGHDGGAQTAADRGERRR